MGGFDFSQVIDLLYVGLFSLIGFTIHLVKKFIAEKIHPLDYLRGYPVRTFSSWLSITGAAVAVYMGTQNMDALSYITMAYMADSLVNKAPTEEEIAAYNRARAHRKCNGGEAEHCPEALAKRKAEEEAAAKQLTENVAES